MILVSPSSVDLRRSAELSAAHVCVLDAEDRLVWVNPAWERFARENGGESVLERWPPGNLYLSAVPEVLLPFLRDAFKRVRAEQAVFEHEYECSSPTQLRRFQMDVRPLDQGALLVTHTLRHEAPLGRDAEPALLALYEGEEGIVTQCCHCRRTRRSDTGKAVWAWVPQWVQQPLPGTSHGLCDICLEYYYPQA